MAPENSQCPRCGNSFPRAQVEGEFSGICPNCLAGLMTTDPGETEANPRTNNAKIPIETIRPPLKPGASFKGFEVLEVLGQGGMGVVYKARQQSLNRLVALKLLNSQLATSDEFVARFDREAKVLASLNHPNVVHVHDFGKEDGLLYLVMEHVDGPTLEDVMKKKPQDPARFLSAVRDVARGLERVHQAGLVHRDVKPSNILIAKDGTAKISDFGLAIETEGSQKLTQSGMFVGTPHYVSPEHAQGKKVDGRSDLYSLGVILFEGYAGRPPFQAPSATALLLKHVNEAPPALYKLAPQSPRAVQEIVRKLLAKNPAARHDTATSLVRDLDRAMEEGKAPKVPGTARKAPLAAPAPEPSKLPIKWIGAGVAAAAVIAILVAVFSGKSEPLPKEEKPAPVVVNRPAPPAPKHEEEKPKEPEQVPVPPAPAPQPTPEPKPQPQEPKPPSAVEEVLRQGDKLFEEARSTYEDGKARSSVEALTDASFKADAARIKFIAVQEIGGDDLKAKAADQLKLIQQFLKLVNESRLAIMEAKGVNPTATPAPAPPPAGRPANPAPVPGVPAVPAPVAAKIAAPDPSTLKDAEKTIRDLFKSDYAKKSAADQLALAQKLLRQARETNDDPKAGYVLLREARELALQAGDLDVALAAIDETAARFEIDLPATRNAALTKLTGTVRSPEAAVALAEAFLDVARLAVDADNYDLAVSASTRADSLAKSSPDLAARIQDLRREIAAIKDEYLKVKSSIDKPGTGDQEALGKFYAFVKGDWDRGLTILAASAKPPLNGLSEKDLAAPAEGSSQVEIGDGWWDLAEKEKAPLRKARLQERAKYWYETAFGAVAGISKLKIEKRLDAIDAAVKGPVDLLRLVDPRVDSVNGGWRMERGALVSPQEWFGRLQVRYLPPEEYDLRIVVERKMNDEDFYIGLVKGDAQIGMCVDAGHGTYTTIGDMAPLASSAPRYDGKLLADNKPAVVVCSVRKKSITVTVDGKKVLSYSWKGDEGRGFLPTKWEIPNRKALFVGAHGSVFTIHRMVLTGISGQGRMDRSAGVSAPPAARSGPEPRPAAGAKVDLLALIDPKRDGVFGEYVMDEKTLITPVVADYARIQIPYVPPAEYDLVLEVERTQGENCLAIGLVGSQQFVAVLDGGFGTDNSALDTLDDKSMMSNETTVKGKQIERGKRATITCSVRKTGVTVTVDGRKVIDWKGSLSRLKLWTNWAVPRKNVLMLGSCCTEYRISRMELTAASGPVGAKSAPAPAVGAGMPAPKGSIDLLALVDPSKDAVDGGWSFEEKTLVSQAGSHVRLMLPYLPPDEYDLRIGVERREGTDGLAFGLARGPNQWTVYVDKLPTEGYHTGTELIDNGMATAVRGPQLVTGQPATFDFKVRRNGFSVYKDGKLLYTWTGQTTRLSNYKNWQVPNPRALFVGQWWNQVRYTEIRLTPVSGEGTLLRKASAPAQVLPPAKGAIDLLALVDPSKDAVGGTWRRQDRAVVSDTTKFARIEIPYEPPAEYDLRVAFSRVEGNSDINQILVAGGKQLVWVLGAGNSRFGFGLIRGKWTDSRENPTIGDAPGFAAGEMHTSLLQVRKDGIKAYVDDVLIREWSTNFADASMASGWAIRHPNALGLASYESPTAFHKVEISEITGRGRKLR